MPWLVVLFHATDSTVGWRNNCDRSIGVVVVFSCVVVRLSLLLLRDYKIAKSQTCIRRCAGDGQTLVSFVHPTPDTQDFFFVVCSVGSWELGSSKDDF